LGLGLRVRVGVRVRAGVRVRVSLGSPFCCCSSATSSMVLLRADTSVLYFCSAFSSAFHTRNVLSLMMLAW
jgi:hypothetical protein